MITSFHSPHPYGLITVAISPSIHAPTSRASTFRSTTPLTPIKNSNTATPIANPPCTLAHIPKNAGNSHRYFTQLSRLSHHRSITTNISQSTTCGLTPALGHNNAATSNPGIIAHLRKCLGTATAIVKPTIPAPITDINVLPPTSCPLYITTFISHS